MFHQDRTKYTLPEHLHTDNRSSGALIAERRDIDAAYQQLTRRTLLALRRYADTLIRVLHIQGKEAGCEGQDLLQEALMRTFAGDRQWNLAVTFDRHLRGVIKSLAYNLRHSARALHEVSTIKAGIYEQTCWHIDSAGSPAPAVERQVEAVEKLEYIRSLFKDDRAATLVLDG